jgi:hypothetical protein
MELTEKQIKRLQKALIFAEVIEPEDSEALCSMALRSLATPPNAVLEGETREEIIEECAKVCDGRVAEMIASSPPDKEMSAYKVGAHNEAACLAIAFRNLKSPDISEAPSSCSSKPGIGHDAVAHADMVPEGCTPVDVAVLRQANTEFACENQRLRQALRFYANRLHWETEGGARSKWDTVSGEPQNWHYRENNTDDAEGIEDGTVAAMALRGEKIDWEDEEPLAIPGEAEYVNAAHASGGKK